MLNTKNYITFVVYLYNRGKMNKQFILTDQEAELIEGIRNFKRSYPNGARGYIFYLRQLFEEMIEMP